jgi:phosphatidylserine decarboxylase
MLKSLSIKQGKKFDDPASKDEIEKFIEFHRLDMSEVLLSLDEFKNFNEFFYRALKPGARPCSAPTNSKIIVSPADCRSVMFNQITNATKIWVKGRDFNVKRLLGNAYPEDAARFEGGALGIFRLAPQDYHRFHIPVDGVMGEPKTIEGEYYTVNPMAIRSALDVYGENVRVLVPIDSVEHGRVMVVCVGAMMVGSTVITRKGGEQVKRAEELGYFKFGGSTILLLFEPGKMRFDDDLVDNSNGALETLVRVGMSVGHSPDEPQWTPDMLNKDLKFTESEKEEAMRRIQGSVSVAPDDLNMSAGSGDESTRKRKLGKQPTINTLAASAM